MAAEQIHFSDCVFTTWSVLSLHREDLQKQLIRCFEIKTKFNGVKELERFKHLNPILNYTSKKQKTCLHELLN